MFFRVFGNYLVTEKVITETQLEALLDYRRKNRVRLGILAVEEKKMTAAQTNEVNRLQALMDKRFGEIAVEKGYLKQEDLEDLIMKQGSPYLMFLQAVTDLKIVTKDQLTAYIKGYQEQQDLTQEQLDRIKYGNINEVSPIFIHTDNEYCNEMLKLVLRNINRFVSDDIFFEPPVQMKTFSAPHFAGQEMLGEENYMLGFAGEEQNLLKIAEAFADEKFTSLNEESYDSICEFINCINGLEARKLGDAGKDVELIPPKNMEDITLYASDDMYVMSVRINNYPISVLTSIGKRCVIM